MTTPMQQPLYRLADWIDDGPVHAPSLDAAAAFLANDGKPWVQPGAIVTLELRYVCAEVDALKGPDGWTLTGGHDAPWTHIACPDPSGDWGYGQQIDAAHKDTWLDDLAGSRSLVGPLSLFRCLHVSARYDERLGVPSLEILGRPWDPAITDEASAA